MSSSASALFSPTDDAFGSRAVDLDSRAIEGLVAVELGAHHARELELAADDADVAASRAAGADDAGQLVEDRREEGGARVPHESDDSLGARVEQGEHIVGRLEMAARTAHGLVVEDLLPPPHLLHRSGIVALAG